MYDGSVFDAVVVQGATVVQLSAAVDQALLVGMDTDLVLDQTLQDIDGVECLDAVCEGAAGEDLHVDQHVVVHRLRVGVGTGSCICYRWVDRHAGNILRSRQCGLSALSIPSRRCR